MKKLNLFLVFSLFILFSANAQKTSEISDGKNVFIGAGVQGDVYVNNNAVKDINVWKTPSLAGNLFIGKWFSHKVGARVFFEGGTLHPFFQERKIMVDQKYVAGRVDLMLDFTNLFRSYSPDRFYSLIPYVGVGGEYSFNALYRPDNADGSTSYLFGGGLLNTFRLSNHVSAFINLGLNVVDAKSDGYKGKNPKLFGTPNYFDGVAAGSVGLIYNFTGATKKEIIAPPPEPPVVKPEPQPEPKPEPQPEPKPEPQPEPTPEPPRIVEYVAPVFDNVFFRLDRSLIDPDQQYKIKNVADYMNTNLGARIYVVGYADKLTGNATYNLFISERRAKNVAKELTQKYGIASDRIIIDWKGDTVQPYQENSKNRVVIFSE